MNWNDVIRYANNGNLKPDRRIEKPMPSGKNY